MDSRKLIDAQFDRAVEIIQALPKTGPIQTGYEEKLTMYSLYKQATVGNVSSPRPGIWDMLGRAKWDAWAKHKDLDSYEAKWLYVDALLKVLRKYSDKTTARELVRELESYGGDTANIVMSGTLNDTTGSQSSGSTASDDDDPHQSRPLPQAMQQGGPSGQHDTHNDSTSEEDSEGETDDDEVPAMQPPVDTLARSYVTATSDRPRSSASSRRYRTPITGSLAMSPRPMYHQNNIPAVQPMPGFETPSAFAGPSTSALPPQIPLELYPSSDVRPTSAGNVSSLYRGMPFATTGNQRSTPRQQLPPLELAIENMQAYMAAITERMDILESSLHPHQYNSSIRSRTNSGGVSPAAGRGSPAGANQQNALVWDIDDLGLWSIILRPLSHGVFALRKLASFFAHDENRSPAAVILRRLCLDVSFLLWVITIIRLIWRRSGTRRREVRAALVMLWHAVLGAKREARVLVSKGA